jgi:long-chain fatty acid transport protein
MRRPIGPSCIGALLLVASVGVAPVASANVPDSYGIGSRASAMAGAVSADADDFSAAYYNPAGIVEAPGVEISIGYMSNAHNLRINDVDNDVAGVHGLVAGLVAPGRVFGVPFAFGIALHMPDDGFSYLLARPQEEPRWELYDTRQQLLYLAATFAARPAEWLELGGGVGYLSDTSGRFAIRGRADVLSPFDSQLEHEVDAELNAVHFPLVGMRLLLDGVGALGLTYRGESKLDLQIEATLDGIVDFAGIDVPLLYALEARTIAAFTPRQVTAGLSFQRIEDLSLNVDVTWLDWSSYESPTANIAALLEVDPPPGTPVELPEQPAPAVVAPPDFRDRIVPRFGVEYRGLGFGAERDVRGRDEKLPLFQLPLRAGYVFEASPVPDQVGITNYVDNDRHSFTIGVGGVLNAPIEELPGSVQLDLHGMFSLLPERVVLKDNAADFIGDYRADGTMVGGGASMRMLF